MIQIQIEKGIPLPPPRLSVSPNACSWCGRREREAGFKTCRQCRDGVRAIYLNKRALGLCGYGGKVCQEPAVEGHATCQKHLEQNTTRIKQLLDGRIRDGLCRRCGKPRFANDTTWCLLCRVKQGLGPLPTKTRKIIRQFWRMDRIAERRTQAENCLPFLDDRAREIFALRHGLHDGVDHTLEEIGSRFELTRERIRQIEERELHRLGDTGIAVNRLWPPYETQRPRRPSVNVGRKATLSPEEAAKRNRARRQARAAIKRGEITPQPCEKCGDGSAHGHHKNYDNALELTWLCRKHHLKAHGKKLLRPVVQKRAKRQEWISSLPAPSSERYSAASIRSVLLADNPKYKTLVRTIGVSGTVLKKVLCGERVTTRILGKVLAYVETLKQERAA